jgi:ABC-2 type transport system ATP-binding protein
MSAAAAISIRDLVKRYAGLGGAAGKLALDGISFDVPEGQIFGLLGPNGAGKSTLINILAGMVVKTSGTAEIWGFDIDRRSPQFQARDWHRPAGDRIRSVLHPLRGAREPGWPLWHPKPRRTAELLRDVHLADKAKAYARTLSGGMKRRLLVAKAMVHSPPVLVLDEPTAGVDVELRRQLWELVGELNAEGVTVILTTHYLEEAEQLCDRIAIIDHGKLIANMPTREMVDLAREKIVVLTLDREMATLPSHPAFLKSESAGERMVEITYDKDRINAGEVLALVQDQGFAIVDVTTREADLEDVFVTLTTAGRAAA